MAINFVTGLPRAGKSLFAIEMVKIRAAKEKRQVYTCNIPNIACGPGEPLEGWLEIDHPDKWMDLPNGSIFLIDELQDFWQKGGTGAKVPLPILELSKHGKRGIDFYIITQEPDLVHATPRLLCQHHYYVVRAWGSHKALVHKFDRMQVHPEKVGKKSEKIPWSYPTEAFGRIDKATGVVIVKPWYKSADVHNVKRKLPWKLFMIPGAVLLAGVFVYAAVMLGKSGIDKAKGGSGSSPAGQSQTGARPPAPAVPPASKAAPMTAAEYVQSFQPRIEGLAYTAPRYDELTKPVNVPYPAACISMGERCECFTQQATKLPVPASLCTQIVKGGYFNDWQAALQQSANGGVPVPSGGAEPVFPPGNPSPVAATIKQG